MDQSSRSTPGGRMKTAPWLLAEPGALVAGRTVDLDSIETRHALGALRLASGHKVVLTDGVGSVASGELFSERRGRVQVVLDVVDCVPPPKGGLTLAMAVLAGTAMDLVVQKAVELGVSRLVPVCCVRSQFGLQRAGARADHWSRLGRQALKQCQRAWAMEVTPPTTLVDLLSHVGSDRGVLAHPSGKTVDSLSLSSSPVLLVGPEGGFAPEEEAGCEEARWPRVWLGPHVLRAETAAIAGSAIIQARLSTESGLHS